MTADGGGGVRSEHNALGVGGGSCQGSTRIAAPLALDLPSGVRAGGGACAEQHSVGLTDDGRVLTWGCADDGRLGRKPKGGRDHALPAVVAFPVADVPVAVAAGAARSVVVASDGAGRALGTLPPAKAARCSVLAGARGGPTSSAARAS